MPTAKAIAVAAASHGSTRLAKLRKRVGLARSIRNIGLTHGCRTDFYSPPPCGEGLGVGVVRCGTMVQYGTTPTPTLPTRGGRRCRSFHPMAQCRGGGEGAQHGAHQGERAQDR